MLLLLSLIFSSSFLFTAARKGFGPGEQEWGYVEVRPGAHMFWWLYYNTLTNETDRVGDKPLIVWLQGGPGVGTSGWGNFVEIGPWDTNLKPREHTWVKKYHVLFVDNPVGAGFSYVDKNATLTTTNSEIARDLMVLIKNFFQNQSQFEGVPIYIGAESYGGKMAVEFAVEWYKAEKEGQIRSNLRGVALGDSWISPIDYILNLGPYLLNTGLIDSEGLEQISELASKINDAVKNEKWSLAQSLRISLHWLVKTKLSPDVDFYNILTKVKPRFSKIGQELAELKELMNKVRKTLGLDANWDDQTGRVYASLNGDQMKPVTDIVEKLLNETNLRVFVFNGQLDVIVNTPGVLKWVENLKWKHIKDWKSAERKPLVINHYVEGFVKEYGNFAFYWINRAGHGVPTDNPEATLAMLQHFTRNETFILPKNDKISLMKRILGK